MVQSGLDWTGLDWTGLDWIGLDGIGLDWLPNHHALPHQRLAHEIARHHSSHNSAYTCGRCARRGSSGNCCENYDGGRSRGRGADGEARGHLGYGRVLPTAKGFDWIGLDWTGLDWTGSPTTTRSPTSASPTSSPTIIVLTVFHSERIGLDWTGLDWTRLDRIGLDWTGLDWIGYDKIGLDRIGLDAWLFVTCRASKRAILVKGAAGLSVDRLPIRSWYHFFNNVSEAAMVANLAYLDSEKKKLPFKLVQLDDGYQVAYPRRTQ
eukprot:5181309-Pyramimonas_sp.AAC.1